MEFDEDDLIRLHMVRQSKVLQGPAVGILEMLISGCDPSTLSGRQQSIYENIIVPKMRECITLCSECSNHVELSQVIDGKRFCEVCEANGRGVPGVIDLLRGVCLRQS